MARALFADREFALEGRDVDDVSIRCSAVGGGESITKRAAENEGGHSIGCKRVQQPAVGRGAGGPPQLSEAVDVHMSSNQQ